MSNISDRSQLVAFVSNGAGKSKPFDGQRLSKVIYKARNGNEAAKPNVCASIPLVTNQDVENQIQALMPYIRSMVADTQDKIIRERYEAGATSIGHDEISVACCVAYLEEDSKSGRMTGDDIRAWFASELQDGIMVALADKLNVGDNPTPDETKKIEQALNVYRDKFASLAGGKTSLSEPVCDKLLTVMALANDAENPITQKLTKRIEDMKKAHNDELLAL